MIIMKTKLPFISTIVFTLLLITKYYRCKREVNYDRKNRYIVQNSETGLRNQNFLDIKRNTKIDCKKIFQGDKTSSMKANRLAARAKDKFRILEQEYISMTENCMEFRSKRGYIAEPVTNEEAHFPIALSILVYKNIDQFERLLRSIYRPQNIYCIHVDLKTNPEMHKAVFSIARCFDNVFVTINSIAVSWGASTLLLADIMCMQEIWNRGHNWKYYLNLAGTEVPLRTNLELVKILTIFNGFNEVEGKTVRANTDRWLSSGREAPHGLQPTKGNIHVAVNRQFVKYLLTNKTSEELLLWTLDTYLPEETFYSTLNHNPQLGIRGSYKGDPELKHYLSRYVVWYGNFMEEECYGYFIHGVCIFGVGDLINLKVRNEFFANKFDIENSFAFDCMEELILNRTKEEMYGTSHFSTSFYKDFLSKLEQYVIW